MRRFCSDVLPFCKAATDNGRLLFIFFAKNQPAEKAKIAVIITELNGIEGARFTEFSIQKEGECQKPNALQVYPIGVYFKYEHRYKKARS